ncbi:hypothetical protein J6590_085711 [Homalodisca vitripennis]|nr:hypothetical protein J6590_085711 [Homalodisca vitripennis]
MGSQIISAERAKLVKTNDSMLRCLGRTCGATVKTDAEKITITTVTHSKHTGSHPVTVRTPFPRKNGGSTTYTPFSAASPFSDCPACISLRWPCTADSSVTWSTAGTSSNNGLETGMTSAYNNTKWEHLDVFRLRFVSS